MEILIRNISDEDAKALDIKAKAAGAEDRGKWLAQQLHNMSGVPARYAYRIMGQVGKGTIRRYSDHVYGTSSTYSNFNREEVDAMEQASNFIRRNAPGDKEKAFELLTSQFGEDQVFEIPA